MRHSWLRSAGSFRIAVPALVALLGVAGYLVTSETISRDRVAAAERRAQVESVRTQGALGRARAYVVGLGNVLAGEQVPDQRRFAQLAGSTAGSVGLVDVMWVQSVANSERRLYESRLGAPITRLTRSGGFEPAPPAASYLAATFSSGTRPELHPGVDVSDWPALAAAIRNPASVFAVAASGPGSLGSQPGSYLLEAGSFGSGGNSRGFLTVFVPGGWLTSSLEDDPRRLAISLGGQRLEGALGSAPAAGASFDALAQHWRIDVGREPASALQSLLPWLALAWPIAAALLVLLVGRGIVRRQRAERQVERIFDVSLDLLGTAGLDGYFKRVNPAFERTLGYSSQELLSRPLLDFVHPEDRERTHEAVDALARGEEVVQFENRYICSDGSERWLEWSTRPVPGEGLVYAVGRDMTDRRRAEDQLREAQRMVEASRDELRLLADEQAALRRVATLVAQGAPPDEVFAAVTEEIWKLLPADVTTMSRYHSDGTISSVAHRSGGGTEIPDPTRRHLGGRNVTTSVAETGRPARMDSYAGSSGEIAAAAYKAGARASVGAPIVVEGRLWGVMVAYSTSDRPLPPDTEARLAQFTELVATAIANADSRAELTASRARVVAAADESRRRIERDLHDGAQQRLLSVALALSAAQATLPPELDELRAELSETASGLADALEDLREIARGIHPAILSEGGLGPALKTLARRAAVPVQLDIRVKRRLPEAVGVAAYYVVSEALTNAAKHARASVVHVELKAEDSIVELAIRDDGVGGAHPDRGSGLIGLRDRVEALGGTFEIQSSPGRGTSLLAKILIDEMEELD